MSNAALDENSRAALTAASSADGVTIVRIKATPTTHALMIEDATTGTDNGNNSGNAMLDENSRPVLTALSSAGDGTVVEVYGDAATGSLLVDSA